MIDFIDERLKGWGSQMRWVYSGKDGWPSRSMLGKLIEEGVLGASASQLIQVFPEVLIGEAVETNAAVKALSEIYREIVFVHYVVIGKAKAKARSLGIHQQTYYQRINYAQCELARLLYGPPVQNSQIVILETAVV